MRKILILLMGYCFITTTFAQTPEQKLQSLGIVLPAPTNPVANYVKFVRTGNLIFYPVMGLPMQMESISPVSWEKNSPLKKVIMRLN